MGLLFFFQEKYHVFYNKIVSGYLNEIFEEIVRKLSVKSKVIVINPFRCCLHATGLI